MNRRYDLDWVRVYAFGLLVLYHVGMYYVTWDWHVKSPQADPSLEPFMLLSSPWRLSLLFLVSGAASAYILERRRQRFLGERSWRLAVPLLFGMAVLVVPQAYYEVVEKLPGGYHDGYWAFYGRYLAADGSFCRDGDCLVLPTWNHLWFLAYLWVYTVLLWVGARWLAPAAWERVRAKVVRALSGVGVLLWPVAFLAVARVALIGRFGSTHALVDDWYNHAQYLGVFLLGFTVARADPFWQTLERQRWTALVLAVLSYAFLAWYFHSGAYSDSNPPPDAVRAIQRAVWAANQWSAMAAILGFAYRFRASNSRTLAYLVPAVLPVYVLHQTVIVVLAHEFKPLAMPPLLEGPLLVLLTFALCFGAYEVIRRVPALKPLFGLKRRKGSGEAGERFLAGGRSGPKRLGSPSSARTAAPRIEQQRRQDHEDGEHLVDWAAAATATVADTTVARRRGGCWKRPGQIDARFALIGGLALACHKDCSTIHADAGSGRHPCPATRQWW